MRILDLALKDLLQIFRDKRSLLFLVAMPIIFTLFMGFAYSSGGNGASEDTRILLGWVNHDPGGLLSEQLHIRLSDSDAVKLVELTPETVDDTVRNGDVAGALIVPAGFSDQLGRNLMRLTLVAEIASAPGQSLFQSLRSSVMQVMSAAEIARFSAEAVGKTGDASELTAGFGAAAQAWSKTASAALVKVETVVAEPAQQWYGDNPYNQASPGILVQFAIFGLVTSGQILMQERKTRTLQRMITTTMRAWEMVAGHMLAMFALVFAQVALLVVFGQLALGVNYAREPFGTLAVSVALGLWIASMGMLIGVVAKDDSQVILFSMMGMFLFSALGGAWFPLEVTGGAFTVIGRLMPSSWAMNGYQNILIRGLGLESVWMPTLIVLAYALGFFALAVWRFRKLEA